MQERRQHNYNEIGIMQALTRQLLDQARVGPYVIPEIVEHTLTTLPETNPMLYAEVKKFQDIRSDVRYRMHLIRQFGNDAVTHLGFSQGTFNALLRRNILTISALREHISSGKKLEPQVAPDVTRCLAEFDELGKIKT